MPSMKDFAMRLIQQNPSIANNPQAQSLMSVIQSGDAKQGEQIARNICDTMGVSPEEAMKQAKSFFNIPK